MKKKPTPYAAKETQARLTSMNAELSGTEYGKGQTEYQEKYLEAELEAAAKGNAEKRKRFI